MGLPIELFDESQSKLELLSCSVCLQILQDPVSPCKHLVICRSHIEAAQSGVDCRECKEARYERPIDAFWVDQKLKALRIRCQYEGCTFSSPNIEEHKCEFEVTPCPNEGCHKRVRKPDLLRHGAECGFALLSCTRPRCTVTFRRIDVEKHNDVCPFYCCPYQIKDGCPFVATKAALDVHTPYCTRIHDRLVSFDALVDQKDKDIARLTRSHMEELDSKDSTIAEQRQKIDRIRQQRNLLRQDTRILQGKYRVAVRRNSEGEAILQIKDGDTTSSHDTTSSPSSSRSLNQHVTSSSPPLIRTSKRSRPPTLAEEEEEPELDSFAINDWVAFKKVKKAQKPKSLLWK